MAEHNPRLRRRELASRLRELRRQAGITVENAAEQLLCSPSKISRIETGTRPPTIRDLRDLLALYGVSDVERTRLMTIAREAKQQGWDDLSIERRADLEIEARKISSYELCVVPWIFQTEQYARAVIMGTLPLIQDRTLEERVNARMTRQELLRGMDSPYLWYLIDESVLHRAIGGSSVMRYQLYEILEVADMPNVTMQIVPFKVGAHPGLNNTFTLLEFDSAIRVPIVYVENLTGTFYLEREEEIIRYREVLERLRAYGLSPADSVKYVQKAIKAFEELV